MSTKIEIVLQEYLALNLHDVVDFEKFNAYAITHHSVGIEGSTLSELDTRLLLDEGITPKGKPLEHSLMVRDHYEALKFVLEQAGKQNATLSVKTIQQINSLVMRSTGSVINSALGTVDVTKGEFRKGNVSAGGTYFVNYAKVIPYTTAVVKNVNEKLLQAPSLSAMDQYKISYDAHFDLVNVHPFYDGNGRTSRLLMNYVQVRNKLPLSIVYKEDKKSYIQCLEKSRTTNDLEPFYEFMFNQLNKQLETEIKLYNAMKNAPDLDIKKENPNQKNNFQSIFF